MFVQYILQKKWRREGIPHQCQEFCSPIVVTEQVKTCLSGYRFRFLTQSDKALMAEIAIVEMGGE